MFGVSRIRKELGGVQHRPWSQSSYVRYKMKKTLKSTEHNSFLFSVSFLLAPGLVDFFLLPIIIEAVMKANG
jgi:hypothetical protein